MQGCVISTYYALDWPVGGLRAILLDVGAALRLTEYRMALAEDGLQNVGARLEISGAGGRRRTSKHQRTSLYA